jgi:RNA polymerase sigma-70 factor (ECF subfamily)
MQLDKSVLHRIRGGDQGALAVLYDLYHLELLAYCRRILGNSQDAEDVVQDVFAKLQSDIKSLRDDALFRNWLFRIARNETLMRIRGRRIDGDIDSDKVWMTETPLDLVEQGETTMIVQKLLDELKPSYRQVLVLREYEGMSYAEIAEALGLSLETVKIRVYRARNSMTEKLRKYYG